MSADPLFRFAPSGEIVSMRPFTWRAEPPVIDEVRVCSWWWMRQRGEDGYTTPHAHEIGWDEDGLFFAEPGCPRVTPEEYGDGVEWMPCMPPEIVPDDDTEAPSKNPDAARRLANGDIDGQREIEQLRSEVRQLSVLVKALKFDVDERNRLRAENERLRDLCAKAAPNGIT